ncbi:MAG: ABC transporter permease subunit [Steroidobacteraceae bacterium]
MKVLPRISVVLLTFLVLAAIVVPWLSPHDYFTPDWNALDLPPTFSRGHLLGTDYLGRDLLVRLAWGCRISLLVAVAASLISLTIGVTWGAVAGYLGGRVDAVMMRTVDVLYSVPFTPLVVVLTVLFGRDLILLFIAIGAVSWLDIARVVRAQTQSLAQREFVIAAEVSGLHPMAILWRHIAPNLVGVVIVWLTLTIPTVILTEAFLSYLGLGAQSPLTSLGVMLADGAAQMRSRPLLLVCPAVVLIMLVYCCNRIGDALRVRHAN